MGILILLKKSTDYLRGGILVKKIIEKLKPLLLIILLPIMLLIFIIYKIVRLLWLGVGALIFVSEFIKLKLLS